MLNPIETIKLIAAALVTAALIACGVIVHGWHRDAQALEGVRTELAAVKAQQEASQKASEGYQRELQDLRTARKPSPVVRVCREPVPAAGSGGGRDGATPGSGELPQTAGPDIGPDLYGLADEADELAARLRACQALLKPPAK
jgi:hypothetical protein